MEQVANMAQEALARYYNTLSKLGYLSQSKIDGLLALCFIEELLEMFPHDITERDYTTVMRALECLAGSNCLVDFPTYDAYVDTVSKNKGRIKPRITEDGILRITGDDAVRVVN